MRVCGRKMVALWQENGCIEKIFMHPKITRASPGSSLVASLYKDASVMKNLPSKMSKFFFCFFELSGPKESRWDTFELTQTLQRVLGSHFKFGGKFKFFRLLHKTQQYGCLWTPMKSLPTISLTKAFLVAQISPNLHKIVPSSKAILI